MDFKEQIGKIEQFLNEVVIDELAKIQTVDLTYMQFVLMGQAIEVLGSFLDNKPMKAKGQSAKRFTASVKKLFGGRYRLLNDNMFLYDKLRNQLTHTFIPGGDMILLNRKNNLNNYKHLESIDGKLILISEDFFEDICNASQRLINALKEGKLKPKTIAF